MKWNTQKARSALDVTPKDVWPLRAIAKGAEVGIEIECEGRGLVEHLDEFWTTHADGSLRGESIEYVLRKPVSRDNVQAALTYLADALKAEGSIIAESYRTSVHVHVNVQPMAFRHILNQICLYILFEDLLVELCGKQRIGNLFCLRAKDAEFLIDELKSCVRTGRYNNLRDNNAFKYGAINVAAMGNYGSLEFRAFRGTTDPDLIQSWVEILLDIKDAALKYSNPQEICMEFSQAGPEKFIAKVFREASQKFLAGATDLHNRLYDGVRLVQEIAYAIPDWSPVDPAESVEQLDNLNKVIYGGDGVVVRANQFVVPHPLGNAAVLDDDDEPFVEQDEEEDEDN